MYKKIMFLTLSILYNQCNLYASEKEEAFTVKATLSNVILYNNNGNAGLCAQTTEKYYQWFVVNKDQLDTVLSNVSTPFNPFALQLKTTLNYEIANLADCMESPDISLETRSAPQSRNAGYHQWMLQYSTEKPLNNCRKAIVNSMKSVVRNNTPEEEAIENFTSLELQDQQTNDENTLKISNEQVCKDMLKHMQENKDIKQYYISLVVNALIHVQDETILSTLKEQLKQDAKDMPLLYPVCDVSLCSKELLNKLSTITHKKSSSNEIIDIENLRIISTTSVSQRIYPGTWKLTYNHYNNIEAVCFSANQKIYRLSPTKLDVILHNFLQYDKLTYTTFLADSTFISIAKPNKEQFTALQKYVKTEDEKLNKSEKTLSPLFFTLLGTCTLFVFIIGILQYKYNILSLKNA